MDINLAEIRQNLALAQTGGATLNLVDQGLSRLFGVEAGLAERAGLDENALDATVDAAVLEGLPPSLLNQPYTDTLVQRISEHLQRPEILEDSYTQTQLETDLAQIGASVIAEHIESLPPEERFQALTELQPVIAEIMPDSDISNVFNRLEGAPEGLQNAFTHAYANNADFREYIVSQGTGAESGFVNDLFEGLQQTHPQSGVPLYRNAEGNVGPESSTHTVPVYDEIRVGAVQDILTEIGNDPNYNIDQLDRVRNSLQAVEDATTPEETRLAELGLIDSIRDAGGNLPAFANLDADPDIAWRFLNNLLDPNMTADRALNTFASELGLEVGSEQYEAFMQQFGQMAEIFKFMLEPYAELIQNHAPGMERAFNGFMNRNEIIGGQRTEIFEAEAERTGETPEAGTTAEEQRAAAAQVQEAVDAGIAHDRGASLPASAPAP